MRLSEWCQTHSLKEFFELMQGETMSSTKEYLFPNLTRIVKEDTLSASSTNKGKIMKNDTVEGLGTVELVSSETSGYLGPDGKFVYGEPPVEAKEIYVQTDEDVASE